MPPLFLTFKKCEIVERFYISYDSNANAVKFETAKNGIELIKDFRCYVPTIAVFQKTHPKMRLSGLASFIVRSETGKIVIR